MSDQSCSACRAQVAPFDGVWLSAKEGTRFLCSRCYNETVAEYLGLDYEHVVFDASFTFLVGWGFCDPSPILI
jgi:hypothetical protein